MGVTALIIMVLIGAAAGWLAGKITKGRGFGIAGNIAIGIIGAVIGGLILGVLGFGAHGLIARLITATIGAVILIYVVGLIKRP
jgi:uncharacterized membrane protein YeaQ/YmgE (transglycosylase-associated protein family)